MKKITWALISYSWYRPLASKVSAESLHLHLLEMNKRKSWILKELCMYTKVNFDGTKPVFRCLIIIFQSCLEGRRAQIAKNRNEWLLKCQSAMSNIFLTFCLALLLCNNPRIVHYIAFTPWQNGSHKAFKVRNRGSSPVPTSKLL